MALIIKRSYPAEYGSYEEYQRARKRGEPEATGYRSAAVLEKEYKRKYLEEAISRLGQEPRFGTIGTLTPAQEQILAGLMRPGVGAPISPVIPGRLPSPMPVPVTGMPAPTPVGVGRAAMPQVARPAYGAMPLAGAAGRATTLGRMTGVSPEEEAAAIERLSRPAMTQFREEILPGIRGAAAATGTTWSTMRAGEEAKAGAGLAESLAALGEQYRMQRREQAMQAVGLGAQEAQAGAQLGISRYGLEMQPYTQALGMAGQEAMQRQQLGVQAGLGAQQLGAQQAMQTQMAQLQARTQAQQLGMGGAMQTQQLGMQAGLLAQQLRAQQGTSRQVMLAQLLGTPMMGYYSY